MAALALLLIALLASAVRSRDLGLLAVVGVVLGVNLFDATFLSGAVLYPVAALAGWRAGTTRIRLGRDYELARQAGTRLALAATDVLIVAATLLTAAALADPDAPSRLLASPLLAALLLWPALAGREGLYPGYGLTAAQELQKHVVAATYAGGIVLVGPVLTRGSWVLPLGALTGGLAATLILLPLGRAAAKRLLHAVRLWGRPVVILGAGATGRRVARALHRTPLDGLHPIAAFDDDPALRGRRVEGVRVRGSLDDAAAFAERHGVRHAIVAIPSLRGPQLDRITSSEHGSFRRVQYVPKLTGLPSDDVVGVDLAGMLALEVRNGLVSPLNRAVKRATDLLLASTLLLLLSPLLAALWLLVRLDSRGGGFHRSERVGQGGRRFACLKFRTMFEDAEERLESLLASNPALREEYDRWHKLHDDPRVTAVGRLLRATSLDELPQLWNVLTGEMSLVGPRPYLVRELPNMPSHRDVILQAKPGITGYWQVTARNDVTFADRLEMEAHYVRNWSIWWDVILLLRTPWAVVVGRGSV